jgi:hypothetical protein
MALVLVGAGYLAWLNRDEVRRLVHRFTADDPRPAEAPLSEEELRGSVQARLDSLAAGRADSVILTPREVAAMVVPEVERRSGSVADSVAIELLDGSVAVRGIVDAARLPAGALGPVSEWIKGRQAVEVRGPLGLLRLGRGEWRIDRVLVRGIPLPRPLWESVLRTVVPGATASITFPVDQWITGVRVTPGGAILYGRPPR